MNEHDKYIIKNYFETTDKPHLCFDLDGTLVQDSNIEQVCLDILQFFMNSGFSISIATGRSFMEAWELLELIKPNADSALYDGQLTFCYKEKQFKQNIKFNFCEYNDLLVKMNDYTPGTVEEYLTQYQFSSNRIKRLFELSFRLYETPEFQLRYEILNCVYMAVPVIKREKDQFFKKLDEFQGHILKVEKHGSCWIKIAPKNVCKATAFGKEIGSMMCFGNGANDFEILSKSKVKVVMANSNPCLRQIQDAVELKESLPEFLLEMIRLL